jgi:hypothetical protein
MKLFYHHMDKWRFRYFRYKQSNQTLTDYRVVDTARDFHVFLGPCIKCSTNELNPQPFSFWFNLPSNLLRRASILKMSGCVIGHHRLIRALTSPSPWHFQCPTFSVSGVGSFTFSWVSIYEKRMKGSWPTERNHIFPCYLRPFSV